jgi:hypothetical protein
LEVPELTGANCGLMLLGVEKSVFARTGFLRLNDLPVTQDEALRRRLNALVTTGDESGAGDALGTKLKELKNACRYNRTGLLPRAEAELAGLEEKQRTLDRLEREIWGEDKDLSDILADDVLSDVDALLAQEAAEKAALEPTPQQSAPVVEEEDEEEEEPEDQEPESNDNLTIGLLITASVLCVAIIGVMIYWLENFL